MSTVFAQLTLTFAVFSSWRCGQITTICLPYKVKPQNKGSPTHNHHYRNVIKPNERALFNFKQRTGHHHPRSRSHPRPPKLILVFIPTEAKAAAAAKQLNTDKSPGKSWHPGWIGWMEWMPNSWPAEINVSTATNALSLRLRGNARASKKIK